MKPASLALALAITLMVLANAALVPALRAFYDVGYSGRVSPQFVTYDPLSIEDMLATADRVGGRSVFWIGDSIVHGRSLPGGDSPRLLEIELQRRFGPDVHVYNAAMPAARTGDKYAVLLRILAHRPSFIVLELKYLEFSRAQVESLPFRYPYLNGVVAEDPAYADRYRDFARYVSTPLAPPTTPLRNELERRANAILSVVRFRTLLQDIAFSGDLFARMMGAAPDPPIVSRPSAPAAPANIGDPRSTPARDPSNFTPAYSSGPFDAFPNAGLFFADRSLEALERSGVPAVSYLAAINHSLVGSLAADERFRSNVSLVTQIVARHSVPFQIDDAVLPEDRFFLDTEHLTVEGHVAMVQRLLADNASVFQQALGR